MSFKDHNITNGKIISYSGLRRAQPLEHPIAMDNKAIFDEKYRVIAIDEQNLILRGIRSGEVLTIKNADPENPLTARDYPPGKLIALNDPSTDINS
jgi:hypothetical protein